MNLIPFQFESASIRVVEIDGEPWFVATDVARALGYADPTTAVRSHCRGVQKLHPIVDVLKRRQDVRVLTEGDVMRLIVGSTLAGAERFERWVFDEVLPRIRKTGSYAVAQQQVPQSFADALQLAADLARTNIALTAQVAEQAPKVAALERIAESEGSMCLTDTAKHLKMPPRAFCKWMADRMWIFRRGNQWAAFQHRIDHGFLVHKVVVLRAAQEDEPERTVTQVRVTSKGLAHLARLLESVPDRTVQAADAAAAAVRALH